MVIKQLREKLDSEVNPFLDALDPIHQELSFFEEPLSSDVWRDKYKWSQDNTIQDMCFRVAQAVNGADGESHVRDAYHTLGAGLFIPAGRILAGAGTGKRVTLVNCFVNAKLDDSIEGICEAQTNTTLTMQQGGGMGTDFSPIRPENAILRRTQAKAAGPLPFMDGWNAWSRTIRLAGARRGAMMGTLCDTHPDLPKFIVAKRQKGRLAEFNVSVLVSDAFMEAVAEDEEWLLHFHTPLEERSPELAQHDFLDEDGIQQYVYSIWRARDLWKLITENTYEWSEPGIIFIDRINELNNLSHVEEIRCTNPCGEQPLPPHGACNLGHVNLARLVSKPFTKQATFNFDLLRSVVGVAQRFLDNVIDVTGYPLPEQQEEQRLKRRTGLGITGLADAMMQMRLRYGSPQSAEFAERVMHTVCIASYEANINLAKEKGPCPVMDPKALSPEAQRTIWSGPSFVANRLPQDTRREVTQHGLRNGVALTVAPTGTISVVFGNLDGSGCECAFAHQYNRRVRQPNKPGQTEDEYKLYENVKGYTHRLYELVVGGTEWPNYFVTHEDLNVEEHITIQAAVQRWVDASVSKTVNCPKDMTYEEFERVYELAYSLGCKGCTTYRPSDVRGSILSVAGDDSNDSRNVPAADEVARRPEMLQGYTYQIKWPRRASALYLTINEDTQGYVREILCASKDTSSFEWVTALTLMITAIFKKGGDVRFVAEELKQVQSVNDATWVDGKFYGSMVAYIGNILERHFNGSHPSPNPNLNTPIQGQPVGMMSGEVCPTCKAPAIIHQEGCKKCTNCQWSSC